MENMVHTVWRNTHKPYNEYQQRWDTGPKKVKTASPHLVALSLVTLMCMHGQRTVPPGTKRFCFILLKMYWEPGNFADNNGARFIVSPFKWSGRFDCCVVLGGFLCLFRFSFHPTGPVWTTLRSIPDLKHRLQRLLLSWWCAQLDPKKNFTYKSFPQLTLRSTHDLKPSDTRTATIVGMSAAMNQKKIQTGSANAFLIDCVSASLFFCWWLLEYVPGGAPFSQLNSGVKDAMVVSTKWWFTSLKYWTKTCKEATKYNQTIPNIQ